jgi:hypothetical protein
VTVLVPFATTNATGRSQRLAILGRLIHIASKAQAYCGSGYCSGVNDYSPSYNYFYDFLFARRKSRRKNSPWMRPEVDKHAGKKATVAAIGGAIITNLLGSGALEDLIRVAGVA